MAALKVYPLDTKLPPTHRFSDLMERATALCNTTELLVDCGMEVAEVPENEQKLVEATVKNFAADPTVSPHLPRMSSPALIQTSLIIREFGQKCLADAETMRNIVKNKLLVESDNDSAQVRLKSVELLGKLTEVGAFTERREVTVNHTTSDELRESLRAKLERLKDEAIDAEFEEIEKAEELSDDVLEVPELDMDDEDYIQDLLDD